MKVLLVILHADPARGGAELYACHLAERLCAAGHETSIAAATFAGVVQPHQRVPIEFDGPTRAVRYRSFCTGLMRHLKANHYDVVHAMLPVPRCDIYHPQAGVETISLQNGTAGKRFWGLIDFKRQAFARVEQHLVDGPNPPLVICMSERSRHETASHFKIDPQRLVTLYNGIDDRRFDPQRTPIKPHKSPTLLFIGHDYARKGLDTAIAALPNVPGAILRVLGNEKPGRFAQLAKAAGVYDRVQFAGPTPHVHQELAAADALLLPARFEPFGMVVIEAMLMGVPPVVSSLAGASELLNDGVDGFIVPSPDDANAWADAIRRVLAGNGTMRAACLARRTELSYDNHLQRLLGVYERVVNERAASVS
jgi:UDP-glucose:(heptosyl)LPS alpha-1,3-glucosyltransferase